MGPAELRNGEPRGDEDAEGQDHELHVVGEDDRDHAAERGVDEDEQEQGDHHRREGPAFSREPGDSDDEFRAHLEEEPHVEDAPEGEDEAAEHADAAVEALLVVFRDRQHLGPTQGADDETGCADEEGGDASDHRDVEGGEAPGESLLGAVHHRDQSHLGAQHRGHAQPGPDAAIRADVGGHVPRIAPNHDADDQRQPEVDDDDGAIDRGEPGLLERFGGLGRHRRRS